MMFSFSGGGSEKNSFSSTGGFTTTDLNSTETFSNPSNFGTMSNLSNPSNFGTLSNPSVFGQSTTFSSGGFGTSFSSFGTSPVSSPFGESSFTNSTFSKIEKIPSFSWKEEKVETKKEVEEKKTTWIEQTDEKKEMEETPKVIFQVKEEEKVVKNEIQKDVQISDGMGDFTAPLISQNHDLCGNFHILNV
jgi:hypothetical protein